MAGTPRAKTQAKNNASKGIEVKKSRADSTLKAGKKQNGSVKKRTTATSRSRSPNAAVAKKPRGAAKAQPITYETIESEASLLSVLLIAALCFFCVYSLFSISPKVHLVECESVGGFAWFVRGAVSNAKETAHTLSQCATKYDEVHPSWTLVLYVAVYLVLQSFAIPGPLILSLISGVLWPLWKAQAVIAFCATLGASLCYCLSKTMKIGELIASLNSARAKQFRTRVEEAEESGNLLYFMLFLRISPLLPNWFVNLASPVAGVPLRTFALATFFGLIPANILHYHSGKQLHELVVHSEQGSGVRNFLILLGLQFLALIPTFFKTQIQQKLKM